MDGNVKSPSKSLTVQLDRLAHKDNERAASRGVGSNPRRAVRRKTYGPSMGTTGKLLELFGLK